MCTLKVDKQNAFSTENFDWCAHVLFVFLLLSFGYQYLEHQIHKIIMPITLFWVLFIQMKIQKNECCTYLKRMQIFGVDWTNSIQPLAHWNHWLFAGFYVVLAHIVYAPINASSRRKEISCAITLFFRPFKLCWNHIFNSCSNTQHLHRGENNIS